MNEIFVQLRDSVIDGQAKVVEQQITQALEGGMDPGSLLTEGLIAAMHEVGQRFEAGEFFVPEMLFAARPWTT